MFPAVRWVRYGRGYGAGCYAYDAGLDASTYPKDYGPYGDDLLLKQVNQGPQHPIWWRVKL